MYVCICNAVTEEEIKEMIKENPNLSIDDLRDMGIANNCFKCAFETEELLLKHIAEQAKSQYNKTNDDIEISNESDQKNTAGTN